MAIDIEVKGDLVRVKLTWMDRVLALKGKLEIPAEKIVSVEVLPRKSVPRGSGTWIRNPGTHIPGLVRHGSYGFGANREFWAVYRQDEVAVITVSDWDYQRLVLGTANPAMDAMRLSQFV